MVGSAQGLFIMAAPRASKNGCHSFGSFPTCLFVKIKGTRFVTLQSMVVYILMGQCSFPRSHAFRNARSSILKKIRLGMLDMKSNESIYWPVVIFLVWP